MTEIQAIHRADQMDGLRRDFMRWWNIVRLPKLANLSSKEQTWAMIEDWLHRGERPDVAPLAKGFVPFKRHK